MFRRKSLFAVALVAAGIAFGASTSHAQSWQDKLKSTLDDATEEATQPPADGVEDAAAQAGEVNPGTDEARAEVDATPAEAEEVKATADGEGETSDEAASALPGSSLSDTAKRAAGKGGSTASDSLAGGATATDAAKKGGAAAVGEALRPGSVPPVSAPAEAAD